MRPFRERVTIALWALWGISCAFFVLNMAWGYSNAKDETFSSYKPDQLQEGINRAMEKGDMQTARVLNAVLQRQQKGVEVQQSVIDAYKSRQMSAKEVSTFEEDMRAGRIYPPPGTKVTVSPEYPSIERLLESFGMAVAFPGLCVVLIQYLLLGLVNPIVLFRKRTK